MDVSHATVDGRNFWMVMRKLLESLSSLNMIYEFDREPFFRFPEIPPPEYRTRRDEVLQVLAKCELLFGIEPLRLCPVFGFYSAGGLHCVRMHQWNISQRIHKMHMRYDRTSPSYEKKLPENVLGYHTLEDFLSYDFAELGREIQLLGAILTNVTSDVQP
jgi:hypothetical protein